jgi:hypothetical protein
MPNLPVRGPAIFWLSLTAYSVYLQLPSISGCCLHQQPNYAPFVALREVLSMDYSIMKNKRKVFDITK